MGCQQQSFDLSWSVTDIVCAQIPLAVYPFIHVYPSLLRLGDLAYSTNLPIDRDSRYGFRWFCWLHAERSMPLFESKFFQEEAWAQDSSKLHQCVQRLPRGILRSNKHAAVWGDLQIRWRSYLEWTWNRWNQSHRNHRTGHEALEGRPFCAGGSRLQDEIILEPQLQNTNIRCNQICCSFLSTEQRKHFIKMSGRQRWTKQYVQPCSPFLAIVRKGHYPPSEVWAARCLSLSTAHRTVSKVLWRCAKGSNIYNL